MKGIQENLQDTGQLGNAEPGPMRSGSKCANRRSYIKPGFDVSWGRERRPALGQRQALLERMR